MQIILALVINWNANHSGRIGHFSPFDDEVWSETATLVLTMNHIGHDRFDWRFCFEKTNNNTINHALTESLNESIWFAFLVKDFMLNMLD